MSVLKKLAGQTAIYGLTTIVGRFLNFLLTPLHTAVLLPAEYGIVTTVYAYIAFLNVIFTYGMETAYFRFATKDENQDYKVFSNAFLLILLTSLLFSGFIFLFSDLISSILGLNESSNLVKWVAGILAVDAISAIPFAKLRLQKKVFQFSAAKVTSIFINIILNIFFLYICPAVFKQEFLESWQPFVNQVYTLENPLKYIFISNLIANLIFIPFIISTFKDFKFQYDLKQLKLMFMYAFPILVMGIAGTTNEMFSRVMLEKLLPVNFYPQMTNLEVMGVFGACYKMAIFMTISIQAFRFASEPFFFSLANDKNAPELYAKVMHYFVAACMVIFLFVALNADWISGFLIKNPIYKSGLNIVPILLIGNVCMGIYFNLSVWYKLTDKTYWGTYITVSGAIVTVILNFVLIPNLGYMGCVWASLFSFFGMATASYILGKKYYPIPYNLTLILGFIGFGILLFQLLNYFHFFIGFSGFLFNNFSILIYILIVGFCLKKQKVRI
ncbi:MAG: polysaccharide biosynthesis protein [Cytophagales bacterium]|nr:MAG: polysaccharide biosynthesis protein [Cytophagales bacterium]